MTTTFDEKEIDFFNTDIHKPTSVEVQDDSNDSAPQGEKSPRTYKDYFERFAQEYFQSRERSGGFLQRLYHRDLAQSNTKALEIIRSSIETPETRAVSHIFSSLFSESLYLKKRLPTEIIDPLVHLRDLHQKRTSSEGHVGLEDVVEAVYDELDDCQTAAVVLLAHEFGYFTLPLQEQEKERIASVITYTTLAREKNIPLENAKKSIRASLYAVPLAYEQARADIGQKRFKEAREKLDNINKYSLDDLRGPVHYQIALSFLSENKIKEAQQSLEEALSHSFPAAYKVTREDVYIRLMGVHLHKKEFDKALTVLKTVEQEFPDSAKLKDYKKYSGVVAKSVKGLEAQLVGFFVEKKYKSAREHICVLLAADAKHIGAHFYTGCIFMEYRTETTAIPFLEKAIQYITEKQTARESYSAPVRKSTVYCTLGQAYARTGNYEMAAKAFIQARKCAPANEEIAKIIKDITTEAETQGKEAFEGEKYQQALASLSAAQKLGASGSWLAWRIGRCYEETGLVIEAQRCYSQILRADPDFKNATIGMKRITKRNQPEGA